MLNFFFQDSKNKGIVFSIHIQESPDINPRTSWSSVDGKCLVQAVKTNATDWMA